MNGEELRVLLIAESPGSLSVTIRRLEGSGCRCSVARSYGEARFLAQTETFELVLGAIPPRGNALSSLIEALAGTQANLFYAYQVEDGCWWLPAFRNGARCLGAPAFRPAEFAAMLERLLEEIREGQAAKSPAPVSTRASADEGSRRHRKAPREALSAAS